VAPSLTAADRRRFKPLIAERVDELEAAPAEIERVPELERMISLAAVRFQSAEAPAGVVDLLVAELERRASPQAATALAGFSLLCAPALAEPAGAALVRVARGGVAAQLLEGFGTLRAIDVRHAELLRAELWTIGMQRPDRDSVQLAAICIERDGHGPFLARGFLTGELSGPEAFESFRSDRHDVEDAPATVEEAAGALALAAARNRELGFSVPHEFAIALPLIARAVNLAPEAVAGLLVPPEGELLWAPPEDDEVFGRVAGRALDDFEDWGTADGRPHIVTVHRSGWRVGSAMLDYAWREHDGCLGHWTLFDLIEFFLRWVPEEETFTHQEMRDAPDVAKELLIYLDEMSALTGEEPLEALLERCDALRADFEEAWSDRSQRGPAQSLIMQMREEGVDPTDREALQAWMEDFNSRPFEERDAILGPPIERPLAEAGVAPSARAPRAKKGKRRAAKASRRRNRR